MLAARRSGRPTILAFCHFGPMVLMALWLRAHGLPASTLVAGKARARSRVKRLKDRVVPFPEIPVAIYTDQLREAIDLIAHTTLLVAVDVQAGKLIDLPVAPGWTFRMATGAIRLAAQYEASLIPCVIWEEEPWRFRFELGDPVPPEFLRGRPDLMRAGQHLLREFMPHLQRHPEQCFRELLHSFQPDDASPSCHVLPGDEVPVPANRGNIA